MTTVLEQDRTTALRRSESPEKLLHRLARWYCAICRFGTVRVANSVFKDGPEDALVYRRNMFGSTLDLPVQRSVTHQLLYLLGERAIPERDLVKQFVDRDLHVIDVGANLGYYAAMFEQKIGSSGQLTLIEPSIENLPELKRNIEINGWGNTRLFECAVGASESTMGLRGGINGGVVSSEEGETEVQVRTLDSIVEELDRRVDLIKIDVEGYEWEVLQGAEQIIIRDQPILFVEFHPRIIADNHGSVTRILDFLKQHYSRLEFFDLPEGCSMIRKLLMQYGGVKPYQTINIQGVPEEELHAGRQQGTFWVVCSAEEPLESPASN